MNVPADIKEIKAVTLESDVLKALAYFDIFRYPLNEKEIRQYLSSHISTTEFENIITQLINDGAIFKLDTFYSLHNDLSLAQRRIDGNERAKQLLPKAKKIGAFLQKFPFVRGVAISGSLSKHFADEKADIDFFMITAPNRLWIARTFLHLYKKLKFITGKQHYYCMNYFIDEEALLINEKSIYTAVEIVTILPCGGNQAITQFFATNKWALERFPYFIPEQPPTTQKVSWIKKLIEAIFNNRFGNRLDNALLNLTAKRWKKKEERFRRNSKDVVMKLVTGKHFSKSDAGSFQQSVLTEYEKKVQQLQKYF